MSRCIVCNKQISKRAYFCDECLKEEVGRPPRHSGLGALLWLIPSPFRAYNVPTHWTYTEKLDWVARRVDRITDRFPQVSATHMVDRICGRAGLAGEEARQQALAQLGRIRANKKAPIWAPWDIVLQPGIQVLVAMTGMLVLLFLAFGP